MSKKIWDFDGELQENGKRVVTTVTDKGLSTNDFTDKDKNKLEYTNVAYCTCSTAADTSAKVASIDGNTNFVLQKGAIAIVKFTVSNTASNCTLNVGGTGAKSIWFSTAKFTGNSTQVCGYANRTLVYVYDGTYWVWVCGGYDATIYTTSLCTTAPATAAKTATCTNYVASEKSWTIVAILYSNSAAGAITLNINSQGAKPIYINGTASSTTNYSLPAGHYLVYYDGTNYYFRTDGKITGCVSEDGGTIRGNLEFIEGGINSHIIDDDGNDQEYWSISDGGKIKCYGIEDEEGNWEIDDSGKMSIDSITSQNWYIESNGTSSFGKVSVNSEIIKGKLEIINGNMSLHDNDDETYFSISYQGDVKCSSIKQNDAHWSIDDSGEMYVDKIGSDNWDITSDGTASFDTVSFNDNYIGKIKHGNYGIAMSNVDGRILIGDIGAYTDKELYTFDDIHNIYEDNDLNNDGYTFIINDTQFYCGTTFLNGINFYKYSSSKYYNLTSTPCKTLSHSYITSGSIQIYEYGLLIYIVFDTVSLSSNLTGLATGYKVTNITMGSLDGWGVGANSFAWIEKDGKLYTNTVTKTAVYGVITAIIDA